jgi:hypothetical protein
MGFEKNFDSSGEMPGEEVKPQVTSSITGAQRIHCEEIGVYLEFLRVKRID